MEERKKNSLEAEMNNVTDICTNKICAGEKLTLEIKVWLYIPCLNHGNALIMVMHLIFSILAKRGDLHFLNF